MRDEWPPQRREAVKTGAPEPQTPTLFCRLVRAVLRDLHRCRSAPRGAGTDSNVFVELHGDLGAVGQTSLETSANNFERGQTDLFVVKVRHAMPCHGGATVL